MIQCKNTRDKINESKISEASLSSKKVQFKNFCAGTLSGVASGSDDAILNDELPYINKWPYDGGHYEIDF